MLDPAQTASATNRTPSPDGALAGLRPVLVLIAATLQTADNDCGCGACRLLRQNAPALAPLLLRMAGLGETP